MLKQTLIVLLLFVGLNGLAQDFYGIVVDEFGHPLPKANVYFNGSTRGTVTNEEGEFEIQIPEVQNKILVISYMGYQPLYIDDFSKNYQTYQLEPKQESLEDVIVVDANIPEDKLMKVFKKLFLGIDRNGKNCNIMNEETISLRFDPTNNTLYASSSEDLIIINERLNYKIRYDLVDFEAKFESDNLRGSNLIHSFFIGTSAYQNLGEVRQKHKRSREAAFKGSIRHFFQAIYHKNLSRENFQIVRNKKNVKAKHVFDILPIEDVLKLNLTDLTIRSADEDDMQEGEVAYSFVVNYQGTKQSILKFTTDHIFINKFGDYAPLQEVILFGDMAEKKIGSMLPSDYKYE